MVDGHFGALGRGHFAFHLSHLDRVRLHWPPAHQHYFVGLERPVATLAVRGEFAALLREVGGARPPHQRLRYVSVVVVGALCVCGWSAVVAVDVLSVAS